MPTQNTYQTPALPGKTPMMNRLLTGAQELGNVTHLYAVTQSQQAQSTRTEIGNRMVRRYFVERQCFLCNQGQFAFPGSTPSVVSIKLSAKTARDSI